MPGVRCAATASVAARTAARSGPPSVGQRRRDADHDVACPADHGRVGRGGEAAVEHVGDVVVGEVVDVRAAGGQRLDDLPVAVEADDAQPAADRLLRQRQADVPEADDDEVQRGAASCVAARRGPSTVTRTVSFPLHPPPVAVLVRLFDGVDRSAS